MIAAGLELRQRLEALSADASGAGDAAPAADGAALPRLDNWLATNRDRYGELPPYAEIARLHGEISALVDAAQRAARRGDRAAVRQAVDRAARRGEHLERAVMALQLEIAVTTGSAR